MKNIRKIKAVSAYIDCSACFSGNSYFLESSIPPLICDDCGFVLADSVQKIQFGNCIFCGNNNFYIQYPLILKFFPPSLICYVCEAEYKGIEPNESDKKFDEKIAQSLRTSEFTIHLKRRVELYN